MYPKGQRSAEQSPSEVEAEHPCSRDELVLQLFKTEDLADRSSDLVIVMRAGGRWDALTDLRPERQLEAEISLTEAAFATPLASSP